MGLGNRAGNRALPARPAVRTQRRAHLLVVPRRCWRTGSRRWRASRRRCASSSRIRGHVAPELARPELGDTDVVLTSYGRGAARMDRGDALVGSSSSDEAQNIKTGSTQTRA